MKRLAAALALLVLILAAGFWSLWDMRRCLDGLEDSAAKIQALSPGDPALLAQSHALADQWVHAEQHLVFYVHHDVLDQITCLVAELPALAQYEEYGAFYGQVEVFLALLDDLWASAVPSYRNLM